MKRTLVFNSLKRLFDHNESEQQTLEHARIKRHRPILREDHFNDKSDGNASASHRTSGEQRLRDFEELLENGYRYRDEPLKRSPFQRDFCDICVRALSANIVGTDWPKIGQKIMQDHGWRDVKKYAAASAPRRFGKSVMLACLMINYAIFVPRSRQCVFSTGARASSDDLDLMVQFLHDLGLSHWIFTKNHECMVLLPDRAKPEDKRKISCYPANEKIRSARSRPAPS